MWTTPLSFFTVTIIKSFSNLFELKSLNYEIKLRFNYQLFQCLNEAEQQVMTFEFYKEGILPWKNCLEKYSDFIKIKFILERFDFHLFFLAVPYVIKYISCISSYSLYLTQCSFKPEFRANIKTSSCRVENHMLDTQHLLIFQAQSVHMCRPQTRPSAEWDCTAGHGATSRTLGFPE